MILRGNSNNNNNNNIYNSNSMRDPSGNDYKNNNGIASINTSFMFNLKVTPFSKSKSNKSAVVGNMQLY